MIMMKTSKENIFNAIKNAGYDYAKYRYDSWAEEYQDELKDENSYYFGSVDSNGNINRDIFCEQIFEQAYQDYIDYGSTSHEEWLEYLGIFNFTKDELDSVKDENLYDYYCEGIERFVLEQYNALNNDYHTS